MRGIMARCAVALSVLEAVVALSMLIVLTSQVFITFPDKRVLGYLVGASIGASLLASLLLWRDNAPGSSDRRLYMVAADILFMFVAMTVLVFEVDGLVRAGAAIVPVLWIVSYCMIFAANGTSNILYGAALTGLVIGMAFVVGLLPVYAMFVFGMVGPAYFGALPVSGIFGAVAWLRFDREVTSS